ncbi:MAG: NAD(P)H-binding protein [Sphingobacteriales bacterium]
MKYVVLGSLGNISKPLAEKLIAAGNEVTVISSSADREKDIIALGAKAAIGDIADTAFLTKIFTGADAVYTMVPPVHNVANWKQHIHDFGKNIAAAIKASGVKKVVELSSIGAHMADGCGPVSGIHFVEMELDKLEGVDVNYLRPGYFYTNLLANIGMIKHGGIMGNNFGADTKVLMTHPNDIAEVAADELLNLDFKGKSIRYIISDERSSKEITSALGKAVGKPELPYVEFTDEQNLAGAIQAGLPEEIASNYVEMGVAIRSGEMFSEYRKYPVEFGKTKLEDFVEDFVMAYNN